MMQLVGAAVKNGFNALILLLLLSGCRSKTLEGLGIELKYEQSRLSNGLTVVMVEDHTVPVISYQTWFRVGSVDERPGITGISHLFEHLMFKGTQKYGPKEFFETLEAKGAEVNATTARDQTAYYENFTPELLDKVIEMEADRLENLKLDEDVLETERQVVMEERKLRTENVPGGKIQEALWALAFRHHPYRWPVIGWAEDVMSLSLDEVAAYFKQHYQPGNATIVIVGDFNAGSTLEKIKKAYGKIRGQARVVRQITNEPEQNEERRLILRDRVASERFAQAYHVTAAKDEDSYALDVAANILFEGTSSRAYRRLVEEKDMMIGVSGSAYTPTFPGLFVISGSMKGHLPAAMAEKALDEVIREVQEGGVSAEEIKVAVRQLTLQLVDSVRTYHGLGQLIGMVMMIFDDPSRFTRDLEKYSRVTAADVRRVTQKYLIPNNRSVVTMMPSVAESEVAAK